MCWREGRTGVGRALVAGRERTCTGRGCPASESAPMVALADMWRPHTHLPYLPTRSANGFMAAHCDSCHPTLIQFVEAFCQLPSEDAAVISPQATPASAAKHTRPIAEVGDLGPASSATHWQPGLAAAVLQLAAAAAVAMMALHSYVTPSCALASASGLPISWPQCLVRLGPTPVMCLVGGLLFPVLCR
jgi:hypothetical protein